MTQHNSHTAVDADAALAQSLVRQAQWATDAGNTVKAARLLKRAERYARGVR